MAIEDLKYQSILALLTACADSIRTKKGTLELIDKQDLPDEILSIQNDSAFIDAIEGDIVELTIPEGTTKIRDYSFSYCTDLKILTIPSSVTSIGRYSFQYCSTLESVNISEGLTDIGSMAFYNCPNLKYIKMPSTIESIDTNAFYSAENCTFDFLNATSIPILKSSGIKIYNTIVVPTNLYDQWKSATNWSSLSSYIVTVDNPIFRNVFFGVDNEYGFTTQSVSDTITYYTSGNAGIDDSFSLCEIRFFSSGTKHLYLDCTQSSENNCDYAVIGKLDTELTDETVSDEDVLHSFKGFNGQTTIDLGVIPNGGHFFRVKFIKDSSASSGSDNFRFRIRME